MKPSATQAISLQRKDFKTYWKEIHLRMLRDHARLFICLEVSIPQYGLLNELAEREHMSMTEISRNLGVSKPTVTSLVDRLEAQGYVKRTTCPTDRRSLWVAISPKGKKLALSIQSRAMDPFLKTFEQFNVKGRETVIGFYELLLKHIEKSIKHHAA